MSNNNALFAKYQIAVERCRNLQGTLEQKEKQWKEIDKQYKKTIDLVKSLCITILQNDKDENQKMLGENYKLGKTDEVIRKASSLYHKYITEQQAVITDIVNENKIQQQELEGLKAQIEGMLTSMKDTAVSDGRGKQSQSDASSGNGNGSDHNPKLPKSINDAAKTGKVKINIEDDDEVDSKLEDEVVEASTAQSPTAHSVPMTVPAKTAKKAKERKANAMTAHMINLNDYDVSDESWEALRCIGEDGISRTSELISAITSKFAVTNSKARNALKALVTIKALQLESISNPLHSQFTVYYLDDIGKRLFINKFGKKPIVSEAEGIARKHANCTHGYGIFFVAEQLRADDYFTKVSDNCPVIRIREGIEYIPDIIAEDRNGQKWYFEYELGHHMQKDFNAKCMKMEHMSEILNFIVPNTNAEKTLLSQIDGWIKGKGRAYFKNRDIKIRLTGASRIKGCDIRKDEYWHYIFEPRKRFLEPMQNE